jgi:hypothetical protein
MRTEYFPAKTFWCFDDANPLAPLIYPITVVAETEKCLFLAPHKEYNNRGHKMPPVMRHRRALRTFHSFREAKDELTREFAQLLRKVSELEAPDAR